MNDTGRTGIWRGRVANVLPRNFDLGTPRDKDPMAAAVTAMAALLASIEAEIDGAPACLDPRRAPARFLPLLARWVDLEWLLERDAQGAYRLRAGGDRLRELIATRAWCLRHRGQKEPLLLTLELATGLDGFRVETDPEKPDAPYCFVLKAPALDATSRAMVRLVVEQEKPAYATWRLVEAGQKHGDDGE